MSTDTLSDVLRAVRLTGAVFFDIDARAPWVAEAPPARAIAPLIMPGSEHVIEYHVILSGRCFAGIVGNEPIELGPGDLIIFPQGDPHVMSSAPGMRGEPDHSIHRPVSAPIPIALHNGEDGGDRTGVICGFLGCDARPFNPLLATLPRTLVVKHEDLERHRHSSLSTLSPLIDLALAESKQRRSGGECVLSRVSELLFVEAIRHYVGTLPAEQSGWLAGLRDPHVGRALSLLHDRPAEAWNLDDLGREVGLSKSLLIERFVHFVGVPPMQYLAQWRMQLAAERLRGSTDTLAEIAERVGYGSESAFSRAFKRLVGVSPAGFREGGR